MKTECCRKSNSGRRQKVGIIENVFLRRSVASFSEERRGNSDILRNIRISEVAGYIGR